MELKNEYIYKWDKKTKEGIKNKELILLNSDESLELIIGDKNRYSLSVIYSSEEITIGKMTLNAGKYSDIEEHDGDEVINVTKGKLIVTIYDEKDKYDPGRVANVVYEVKKGQKFLIPKNFAHVYKNINDANMEAMIAISPRL